MKFKRRMSSGILIVACLTGGCGGADQPGSADQDNADSSTRSGSSMPADGAPTDGTVDQLPFDSAIAMLFGFDPEMAAAAVDRAVIRQASTCLSGRGWDVHQDTFVQFESRPEPLDGVAENAQAMIHRGRQYKDLRWDDPTFAEGAMDCLGSATKQVANPYGVVNEQLDDVTREISDQIEADPRFQAALAENGKCLHDAGYDEGELGELQQAESEQTSTIVQAYLGESISQDEAIAQIDVVTSRNDTWRAAVDRCAKPYDKVEHQLVAEYQEAYLDGHPGLIGEAAASAADAREQIEPFLID